MGDNSGSDSRTDNLLIHGMLFSDYNSVTEYLFGKIPQFQRVGASAYKPGLENMRAMLDVIGNPHRKLKSIHVAGTNGKGSVSNLLAATLQKAGYKTGLYTSPHLVDFRERMRIDGAMIPEAEVIDFVNQNQELIEKFAPSFFELTTLMAFDYFVRNNVDVAVIEVGLGGRLDSTNVIAPDLCVITNISKDHTQFLGNTIAEIASEKAGIIKAEIPVVIGESNGEYNHVFEQKAREESAPLVYADAEPRSIDCQLKGIYQQKNVSTALCAIEQLRRRGYNISAEQVADGFAHVCDITGFTGRWMQIGDNPKVVCDAGHNVGGISYVVEQLANEQYRQLLMVVGFVSDKDIENILGMLPRDAKYYFAKASIPRALDAGKLCEMAEPHGLKGYSFDSVSEAYDAALNDADENDMVFVGGSCFVVADLLKYLQDR